MPHPPLMALLSEFVKSCNLLHHGDDLFLYAKGKAWAVPQCQVKHKLCGTAPFVGRAAHCTEQCVHWDYEKGAFFSIPVSVAFLPQWLFWNYGMWCICHPWWKRKQHFSPRGYYKETLSGLTFAIRNGTVRVLSRSRFQSPGEAFLITVYLDRHSLSHREENRAITQCLRHADFPTLL